MGLAGSVALMDSSACKRKDHVLSRGACPAERHSSIYHLNPSLNSYGLARQGRPEICRVLRADVVPFERTANIKFSQGAANAGVAICPPQCLACDLAVSGLERRWMVVLVGGRVCNQHGMDRAALAADGSIGQLLRDSCLGTLNEVRGLVLGGIGAVEDNPPLGILPWLLIELAQVVKRRWVVGSHPLAWILSAWRDAMLDHLLKVGVVVVTDAGLGLGGQDPT